jgi:competence protein ComGC
MNLQGGWVVVVVVVVVVVIMIPNLTHKEASKSFFASMFKP